MFWPRDWLGNEMGFKNVRIHSYGYPSEWTAKKGSALTIHDFGQALLADIHNSPALRKNGEVRPSMSLEISTSRGPGRCG